MKRAKRKRKTSQSSGNKPAQGCKLPSDEDTFYDAQDESSVPTDRGGRMPSVRTCDVHNKSDDKSEPSVAKLVPNIGKTMPYFPRHHLDIAKYSVGTQTPPRKKDKRKQTLEQLEERAGPAVETLRQNVSFSSDEEYKDAKEISTDEVDATRPFEGRRNVRTQTSQHIKPWGDCRADKARMSSKRTRDSQPLALENVGQIPCQDQTRKNDASCCACLWSILYYLALMLFISVLLSLFLTVFLVFSHNHGLGIGPNLIYSDADSIRHSINPYLNLRHNAPPPT